MNRAVDVRALVSHIVRGDGVDRCRICMGETSQGQVFLEDTVMLDGERPVTLAELLESLTGLEVSLDGVLPSTLCVTCSNSAVTAGKFLYICHDTYKLWQNAIDSLKDLPALNHNDKNNKMYAVLSNNLKTITVTNKWPKENIEKVKCVCPDCGKKFKYLNQLQTHLLEAGFNRQTCLYCPTVTSRKDIINHMLEMHDRQPHFCTICHIPFKSQLNLEKHTIDYHSGSFSCSICSQCFESEQALNKHDNVHCLKVCANCNIQFKNMPCYLYHIKKCSSKVTLLETKCYCDYCGKQFSAKKYLKTHMVIVHSRTTHSPCAYCGKIFAAAHMGTHIKVAHSKINKCCPTCGIVLKSDLGLKQHQRLHTGEKPYKCSYCDMRFSGSSRRSEHVLKLHRSNENFLRHKCDTCTAKFRLPYQLRKHKLLVHSQTGPNDFEFTCDDCGEKFGSCRGLIHHRRKHQQIPFATDMTKQNNVIYKKTNEL